MKKLTVIALLFAAVVPVNAAIIQFDIIGRSGAGMLTTNENPSASGSGTGGEVATGITFDDVSNILTINVGWGSGKGFTDLTGNVTVAHIHQSTGLTTNGSVQINLDGATPGFSNSATNGGWTNTQVTLTAPQATALNSGLLYLNAHTAANPGGEIRGNLVAIPEPSVAGLLAVMGLGMLRRRRRA